MVGFPALMLLPALVPADRRRWGWLFVLAIAVGLADIIDTFSHLHTALEISAIRVCNGAVIGALVGAARSRSTAACPPVTAPRFLLSGYYGFGNLGDEALLAASSAGCDAGYPGTTIDVLSHDPGRTAARLGVEATPRADLRAVRKAIARADVVLSGGGGLLQDTTSLQSLLYYAGIVRAATGRRSAR